MYERFTDRARKVMELANEEAKRFKHEYIGTEHILLGLIKEGAGVAANVLKNLDVDPQKIRREVEKLVLSGPDVPAKGQLPQTPRAKKVVEYAIEEARNSNQPYVGTEHVLLGLLRETEGVAAQILMNLGLTLDKARAEIRSLLGQAPGDEPRKEPPKASPASKTPALDSFSRDQTALARAGRLNPVVGRDDELSRVMQILCRRERNNPVLLGRPGVGKTAIVEGLAQKIARNEVPDPLFDARIVAPDLALLVAGTKYRGEFESRLNALMNEIRRSKKIILFIDDFHLLARAGAFQGGLDAARVLRPAIRRNELKCIGASTREEYREHIEKNAPVAARFEIVPVEPPSPEVAIDILRAVRDRFERHHCLKITDDALALAVEVSSWYDSRRCLPDSAINIIDDCCSRRAVGLRAASPQLRALEVEIERLSREKEQAVADQQFDEAVALRQRVDELKREKQAALRQWREENEPRTVIDAAAVIDTLSELTGLSADEVRRVDRTTVPRHPPSDVTAGLPGFERRQCELLLHGGAVKVTRGTGLALVPPTPAFREIFDSAILPAMRENGIGAVLAEEVFGPGSLAARVGPLIRSTELIVADLSGRDPNVMLALGLCLGASRLPILLVRDPSELPADLQTLRCVKYEATAAGTDALRQELSAAVRAFLAASRRSLAAE